MFTVNLWTISWSFPLDFSGPWTGLVLIPNSSPSFGIRHQRADVIGIRGMRGSPEAVGIGEDLWTQGEFMLTLSEIYHI